MLSLSEISRLLEQLDGAPADALESEILECKAWDTTPSGRQNNIKKLRETVVCLANSRGGTILVGVADRKKTRHDAIQGVPEAVATEQLRRQIYDGTEPHILVEIEELREEEGRLLVIYVPRGMPPHTTSEGVGKIRVGKECKPLKGSDLARLMLSHGSVDLTAEVIAGSSTADLDPDQVALLQRALRAEGGSEELARLPEKQLLRNLGLIRDETLTLSAVLLAGTSSALSRWATQHEVVFLRYRSQTRYDVRHDLKGPLLSVLEDLQRLLRAHLEIATAPGGGFEELSLPDVTWSAAREAVLNALLHRDWFQRQSVIIAVHGDRLEVSSPGGFIGGVTPENVLRHPPVRRNPLLAQVFQSLGMVNRAGVGVDRIYEELLRLGKGPPRYEADEAHVKLVLPKLSHPGLARFVATEERAGRRLELDDLILLRCLIERGLVDRWSGATALQLPEEEAASCLIDLRKRGYAVAQGRGRGTSYRLARPLSDLLRGEIETNLDLQLDEEAALLRIQTTLAERKRMTNQEIQRLTGLTRTDVLRLMTRLRQNGTAILRGRGRGAHYVPGPSAEDR